MAFDEGLGPSRPARLRFVSLTASLVTLLILFAAACSGGGSGEAERPERPAETPPVANTPSASAQGDGTAPGPNVVTTYRSPTCGCCAEYERYLEREGFEVESIVTDGLSEMKDGLGIPADMRSCHTAMVGGYFVEGHVPVEAIRKLLEERPPIDGIALPGMLSGSPGMGGEKQGPFTIYSIAGGTVDEFMTI